MTPNTYNQRITSHPTSTTHDSKHRQSMYYITPYFNYPRLETRQSTYYNTLFNYPRRIYTTPCTPSKLQLPNYPRLQTQTINVLHHTLLQLPTTLNTDNQRITSHPTSTTHDSKHRQSTYFTPCFNYPRLQTQTINVLHHTLLQLPTTPNTDNQRITSHPTSTTHDSKHRQSTYYSHTLLQLPMTPNTDNQCITSHPTSTTHNSKHRQSRITSHPTSTTHDSKHRQSTYYTTPCFTHDSKHRQSTYYTTPCFNYPRL